MVDKIKKALQKLRGGEKEKVGKILSDLKKGKTRQMDIKKLKGRDDVFRIRKGKIRIIYRVDKKGEVFLLTIERRSDTTYNF